MQKSNNRYMLEALAEQTKEPTKFGGPGSFVPNRAQLRRAGIGITRRTGKGHARIKRARAKHKEA